MRIIKPLVIILTIAMAGCGQFQSNATKQASVMLEENFQNPPDSTRSWVYWFWINGNITKEGITADLEAMKEVGVGGVLWMEVSGPYWAPGGKVKPYSDEWNSLMQWAIAEADRLGLLFDLTVDFGYGSGGPHITPDNSMQKIFWNKVVVDGGKTVDAIVDKPYVSKDNVDKAWLRPGETLHPKVVKNIAEVDSYNDIAIFAVPFSAEMDTFQMPQLHLRTGMGESTYFVRLNELLPPEKAIIPLNDVIDLSDKIDQNGKLNWDAPPGKWQIVRLGHASIYKMTRPCSSDAVGLEADRLSIKGINAHFDAFLKPIYEGAGDAAGRTLKYVHVDSWEAGSQQWTPEFQQEFLERRGYDIKPWLPVLGGIVVESPVLTERFLWDFRTTISELILDNYIGQLKELSAPYGIEFSTEAYGDLNINQMKYAETADLPICEFWASGSGPYKIAGYQYNTMKVMASAAHTNGGNVVGAEAFTGDRGWEYHPANLKALGDEAFCQGVNQFILHLSAHQAYDKMVPGLTHRRWGQHFQRHNTWWNYSSAWFEYIRRSQFLLQQGQFVADVCYLFGEGAPLSAHNMTLDLPHGYDYDFCSSDILEQMEVEGGNIVLPSGMSYKYLLLPDNDRLTLASAEKIKVLVEGGAKVVAQQQIKGTPGLEGYPESNQKVQEIADWLWNQDNVYKEANWEYIFENGNVTPDFHGEGLHYIHRRIENIDIYFVANPDSINVEMECAFRVTGKIPELWNPETGEIRELHEYSIKDAGCSIPLKFGPSESWFVVFRKTKHAEKVATSNFPDYEKISSIEGEWEVSFDPKWGGPEEKVTFERLKDWAESDNPKIRYYSGTAVYRKSFTMTEADLKASDPVMLDLGEVAIMARIKVNGKDCGIVWKQPYRLDVSDALVVGENDLEIDVVNTWINRMIGDEFLPVDNEWLSWETLKNWPDWFLNDEPRPSGRYTYTTAKHYTKEDKPVLSGLIGPVILYYKEYTKIK